MLSKRGVFFLYLCELKVYCCLMMNEGERNNKTKQKTHLCIFKSQKDWKNRSFALQTKRKSVKKVQLNFCSFFLFHKSLIILLGIIIQFFKLINLKKAPFYISVFLTNEQQQNMKKK